jgi:CubicO group peptidase (beta-lactamase class C family)
MKMVVGRGGLAVAMGALCASSAWAIPADFKTKADAYLKSTYPADGPGAAAIVVEHGKVIYSGGQGLADIATKRKIDPGTVFRLGSLTKQFTASVILQLDQEGKLSLSDPVSKYLPDYPEPGAHATIAQLLNHSSGIKNFTEIPSLMMSGRRAQPITTSQLIDVFKNEPVDFAPGTKYHYSGSGYVLLGAIIEKMTGKPWYIAIGERIAKPLHLRTIRYGVEESRIPNMAIGYSTEEGKVVPASPLDMSNPHAAGSLIGSVVDFARWNEALQKGRVLNAREYARMIAPTRLLDGSEVPYGFGIGLGKLRNRNTILHSGDTAGFDTSAIYVPKEDLFVAVFTNSDSPAVSPMVARMVIAAMALGEPFPVFEKRPVAAPEIEPLLGVYRLKAGERRFFMKGQRLFTRRTGASDEEVFAAGSDRFFYGPTTLTWFEVKRDPGGRHVMTTYQGAAQTPEIAVRTGPIPADVAVNVSRTILQRYTGRYKSDRGIASVAVSEDGTLTLQVGRQSPRRLLPVSDTEFQVEGIDAKVVFHATKDAVTDLTYMQGEHQIRAEREPSGS